MNNYLATAKALSLAYKLLNGTLTDEQLDFKHSDGSTARNKMGEIKEVLEIALKDLWAKHKEMQEIVEVLEENKLLPKVIIWRSDDPDNNRQELIDSLTADRQFTIYKEDQTIVHSVLIKIWTGTLEDYSKEAGYDANVAVILDKFSNLTDFHYYTEIWEIHT